MKYLYPKTKKTQRQWFDFFRKVDPVFADKSGPGRVEFDNVTREELMVMFLAQTNLLNGAREHCRAILNGEV